MIRCPSCQGYARPYFCSSCYQVICPTCAKVGLCCECYIKKRDEIDIYEQEKMLMVDK